MKKLKNPCFYFICVFFVLANQIAEGLVTRAERGLDLSKSITEIRAEYGIVPKTYALYPEDPIDVIIPYTSKDLCTLKSCIDGIRKNCAKVRRVIVVSAKEAAVEAEWFNEALFPFGKSDIANEIFQDTVKAKSFIHHKKSRAGWIYQQLLKLYAPFVIPNLSSNVLVLDADIMFLKPVDFMDSKGNPLFGTGVEYYPPYFAQMARVLPWMRRVHPQHSGIVHHMLFQRSILQDFFSQVESLHQLPMWKALCRSIDQKEAYGSSMSEYELYFNFCLLSTDQASIRPLQWEDTCSLEAFQNSKASSNSFVSYHSYVRPSQEVENNSCYLDGRLPKDNGRYLTFLQALDLLSERNVKTIVETGTERWQDASYCFDGDGGSTILFGNWARDHDAIMYSVDINPTHIQYAKENAKEYARNVFFVCEDSAQFLTNFAGTIDFLYLDSWDYSENDPLPAQNHNLREVMAAYDKLTDDSIIMIDDCNIPGGGKGKLAIAYLLERGWYAHINRHHVLLLKRK